MRSLGDMQQFQDLSAVQTSSQQNDIVHQHVAAGIQAAWRNKDVALNQANAGILAEGQLSQSREE